MAWDGYDERVGPRRPRASRHRRLGLARLFPTSAKRRCATHRGNMKAAQPEYRTGARQSARGVHSRHPGQRSYRQYQVRRCPPARLAWRVSEATGANISFVKGQVLHTLTAPTMTIGAATDAAIEPLATFIAKGIVPALLKSRPGAAPSPREHWWRGHKQRFSWPPGTSGLVRLSPRYRVARCRRGAKTSEDSAPGLHRGACRWE
jgi:hypothetical protein